MLPHKGHFRLPVKSQCGYLSNY